MLALAAAGMAGAFAASGCLHPAEDELTKAVVSGERPVAMEGSDAFFGGKVTARVTLSRGIGRGLKRTSRDRDSAYSAYANNDDKFLIGTPLPPVTLHLILSNPGTEPITVKIIDFVSEMGNFAIDPDSLTIPPGQTAEPTSMVSQLGVSSDEMPFKVTLKLGSVKETRTFPVKIIHQDPGAGAPAAK